MADLTFNTTPGAVVERKLLILYLNTGTAELPVWSAIGKRVEDSSEEYDWGEETKTDIFGNSYTTMKKPTITQTFDPGELDAGDVAQVKIWNAPINGADLLIVFPQAGILGSAAPAKRYEFCLIRPKFSPNMPFDVTFGGVQKDGTASVENGVVIFSQHCPNNP